MGKLVVEGSIKIGGEGGIDINEWAELAKDNDTRSYVVFDSNNKYLTITNPSYNKKYVTAYNSKKRTKEQQVDADNFQKEHSLYLGKIAGDNIWLVEKGFRPTYTQITKDIVTPHTSESSFIITYNSSTKTTRINLSRNKSYSRFKLQNIKDLSPHAGYFIDLSISCFYILLQGAGSTGERGYTNDRWLVANENESGLGGSAGGYVFAFVDMSKLKKLEVSLSFGAGMDKPSETTIVGPQKSYIRYDNGQGWTNLAVFEGGGPVFPESYIDELNKVFGNGYAEGLRDYYKNISYSIGSINEVDGFKVLKSKIKANMLIKDTTSLSIDPYYCESKKLKYTKKVGSTNYGGGGEASIFGNGGNGGAEMSAGSSGGVGAGGGGSAAPGGDGKITASDQYLAGGSGGPAGFLLFY